jgi:hypothetical protein
MAAYNTETKACSAAMAVYSTAMVIYKTEISNYTGFNKVASVKQETIKQIV